MKLKDSPPATITAFCDRCHATEIYPESSRTAVWHEIRFDCAAIDLCRNCGNELREWLRPKGTRAAGDAGEGKR